MLVESTYNNDKWQEWVNDASEKLKDPANRTTVFNPLNGDVLIKLPSLHEYKGKFCNYAIWENDELKYIGKSKDVGARLKDHCFKMPKKGHHNVHSHIVQCLKKKKKISVSLIAVPEQIYSSIEESLIEQNNLYDSGIGWNKRRS